MLRLSFPAKQATGSGEILSATAQRLVQYGCTEGQAHTLARLISLEREDPHARPLPYFRHAHPPVQRTCIKSRGVVDDFGGGKGEVSSRSRCRSTAYTFCLNHTGTSDLGIVAPWLDSSSASVSWFGICEGSHGESRSIVNKLFTIPPSIGWQFSIRRHLSLCSSCPLN